jgi:transposase-like protein
LSARKYATKTPGKHGVRCTHCGSDDVIKNGAGDGSNDGKQRWQCNKCGKRTTAIVRDESTGIDRGIVAKLYRRVMQSKGIQRYVVTAAQNATPVNKPFFAALQTYCRINKAQLIVIPYRYKNPTSMWSKAAENDDWWAEELVPFLMDRRIKLNANLILLADIKTQPTATSPLQGFESIAGALSAIIGHPKLELLTVPTPQHRTSKILTSTGAVTSRNYLPSKAGKKGEFHHTFGACAVEVKGKAFHLRQLNAVKDGSFMDLAWNYTGEGRTPTGGVSALVMGDSHIEFIDPKVVTATFGKGGIVDSLKPEYVVWHDAHDFYSRNHHHQGEAFIEYVKHHTGTDDVGAMLQKTFDFIDKSTRPWVKNVFVPSNHPDALAKWVKRADWRTDPRNAKFLLNTSLAMLEGSSMDTSGAKTICPFIYWAKKMLKTAKQAVFLKHEESLQVHGIELGYHGHYGLNGARGTRLGFSKIGVKVVIGHTHSPGIREGAYQTGTNSRLKLEYVHGPSSWLQTDCVVYKNGKRSLINIINGEWRA